MVVPVYHYWFGAVGVPTSSFESYYHFRPPSFHYHHHHHLFRCIHPIHHSRCIPYLPHLHPLLPIQNLRHIPPYYFRLQFLRLHPILPPLLYFLLLLLLYQQQHPKPSGTAFQGNYRYPHTCLLPNVQSTLFLYDVQFLLQSKLYVLDALHVDQSYDVSKPIWLSCRFFASIQFSSSAGDTDIFLLIFVCFYVSKLLGSMLSAHPIVE